MLPIEQLHIHAFRGLRDLKLEGLEHFNLFVGRNNSGKTTVLEAISTYAHPLSPGEWVETVRRREITSSRASLLEALRWMFPQTGDAPPGKYEGSTRVSGSGRFPLRESSAHLVEVEGISGGAELEAEAAASLPIADSGLQRGVVLTLETIFDGPITFPELIKVILWERSRGPLPYASIGPSLPSATITPFSHRVQRLEVEALSEAIFGDIKATVLELVRIFDPAIRDLEVLQRPRSETTVYVRHDKLGTAPLSSFGDGLRRVLLLGVTLATVHGGVLLVDEIETAIHFEALDKAFRWLRRAAKDLDVQVFATTHSLEAVDALLMAGDDESLAAYRLSMHESGVSAQRFSGSKLRRLREELGQEVRG